MNTFNELWRKLAKTKEYRREFVASLLKRGTAMQIQSLLKKREWTQGQLAEKSGLTQGVISRAKNPAYGNLTFNTVIDIAAGFDVAFIGRFVPFSEFAKWVQSVPSDMSFEIPSFDAEEAKIQELLKPLESFAANEKSPPGDEGEKVANAASKGKDNEFDVPAGMFNSNFSQQLASGNTAAAGGQL
jgi:transcriptional regulator with XRE-family HTH domain